ncbi:MAG TPA: sigma-54 dependent transcriptional regulator [Polyangia bacterium]|jgi:two-component system response regulator HydG
MGERILIVEDDRTMASFLEKGLARRGYGVVTAADGAAAVVAIGAEDFDVVVTDLNMPGLSGVELCERVVASRPDLPVVLITAFGSLDTAVAAIRAGAYDFIAKPFEIDVLTLTLERAVQHKRLREEVKRLRAVVEKGQAGTPALGESPAMRRLEDLIARVADSDASVLISGESGTGKEVVARALHARGHRARGPFVALNCAAVPEALLESELFGHVRGAFTDARSDRAGLFVQASGGTLLLDEIGEMPLGLQPKILRALQERVVRPVGGTVEVAFDARIVTATNRDLETMVEEGRFREDLFFRVNVIHLEVPPLRARGNDILLLAQQFLDAYAARAHKSLGALTPEVAQRLLAYRWPGNVRELSNCMERAVALARFDRVTVDDLPERVQQFRAQHVLDPGDDPALLVPLEEVERRYILRVLEAVGGNRSSAARILGLDRKTLQRKLELYGQSGDTKS